MSPLKRRQMLSRVFVSAVILSLSVSAAAEDIAAPKLAEKCFPAEGLVQFYAKMTELKPARVDTLEAVMNAKFHREDDAMVLPKFWSRSGGQDVPFTVKEDGQVPDFHERIQKLPETAELCGQLMTPKGEEPKVGINIDNDILFKNRTGPYSLAELQDGVADGKSFYKKMLGGPMSLLVPSMTHISLQYSDKTAPLKVRFTQAGQAVSRPPIETFGRTFVIALEDIEASGADTFHVDGGPFKLMPTPSVKKMKSLGFRAEGEEDAPKDD